MVKSLDPGKVKGISISRLSSVVAFGEDGEILVDPIIYSDRRSTEEAEIIKREVGERQTL